QGGVQHRHARRHAVDQYRHGPGQCHLHRRDGQRLAAGQLRLPGVDQRQHDLRRLLPRPQRPLRRGRQLLHRLGGAQPAASRALAGSDNPPLPALGNGLDGFNGAYTYGSGSVFPTNFWLAANYWVDVVFYNASSDTQPPTAPTNLTASGGVGSVSLSWTASSD